MLFYSAVYCVFLMCIGESLSSDFPWYNISVSHLQDQKGRVYAQVHLEHEQPLDLYVGHTGKDTIAKVISLEEKIFTSKTCHSPPAPLGYEFISGLGYYKIYDEKAKKSWKAAEELCENEGGHLLIINSELELRAMLLLIFFSSARDYYYWIGFHDQYKEGDFVTVFNQTLESIGINKIYPGELRGETSENCGGLHFNVNGKQYGFVDYHCTSAQPFICEQELS